MKCDKPIGFAFV